MQTGSPQHLWLFNFCGEEDIIQGAKGDKGLSLGRVG